MKKLSLLIVLLFLGSCVSNKPFVKTDKTVTIRDTTYIKGDTIAFKTPCLGIDTVLYKEGFSVHLKIQDNIITINVTSPKHELVSTKTTNDKSYSTISIEKKKLVIEKKEKRDSTNEILKYKKLVNTAKKDSLRFDVKKIKAVHNIPGFFGKIWAQFKNLILLISLIINVILILKSTFLKLINKIL